MASTPAPELLGDPLIGMPVALGIGLLIGLERERRKGQGPGRAAAGLRTFALAGLAGALAAWAGGGAGVAAGALAVGALAALAYWRGPRDDPGLTTELALLVTYLLGVIALAQPALAAGLGVVVAVLLAARGRLHRLATELLSEDELHDALLLAAMALVVVPLVPQQPVAWLGGVTPRTLAWVVLMILVLQGAGHVARRALGDRAGLAVSGLLGGFVSSTATVSAMAGQARRHPDTAAAALAGALLSTAATWAQALLMLLPLAPAVAATLWAPALAGGGLALAVGAWRARGATAAAAGPVPPGRALRPKEALAVAAALGAVTAATHWAGARFGDAGVLAGVAIAGLADAHAGIAALGAQSGAGQMPLRTAGAGVLAAIAASSLTRAVLAFAVGGPRFGAAVAGTLAASTGAAVVVWLLQ